jgi:acyl-coenzyme A thioesterase PaaI-like protein
VLAGDVRAVAVALNRGRTAVTVQTTLRDETEKLVAQTTQIQVVRMTS